MSIVRIGLGETKGYGAGYEAIFKKKGGAAKKPAAAATPVTAKGAKKPAGKKPGKKK